jgi:hypothetical protein
MLMTVARRVMSANLKTLTLDRLAYRLRLATRSSI